MKTLHRNKRKLYLCQVYNDNNLRKYKEPIELKENWAITNTYSDLNNMGIDCGDYARIKTSADHAKYYHLGDRIFLYSTPPEVHDAMCRKADFEVYKNPIVTLNECDIHLKRISGKNGNNIF